ncbi:bacterial low temperature requirement A protein-domain-containing protein [Halteromyces radiatus]|uniref:bacterial low temperature requirement A protein-domain-containing protein n=1 Tax=Halteromyces radiatus TaxID=101107 RepID=UPI002220F7F0|nr:bacterial low temperature requirement A protein-domain-containing protein [Halteromyces radiatus]KAI8086234.1 bacterial low temperature requirement A protein-domain-containing protein [Halteromyces radiatus]
MMSLATSVVTREVVLHSLVPSSFVPSVIRGGPSIRQPLRHPRNQTNENNEPIIEEDPEAFSFQQEPTSDGDGVILNDEQATHRHHHHHLHHHHLGSDISKLPSNGGSSNFAPQHDKDGKPIKTHGPETFGDIMLHPIKQLEFHRRRLSVFEHEKKEWDEKHQQSTGTDGVPVNTTSDEEAPPAANKPKVKIVIHFKHLMGEQAVRVTKPIIDQLMDPLSLTADEILRLYKVNDTDDLVEFFHSTKRDYSLKIHKTVNLHQKKEELKAEIEEKKQELEERAHIKLRQNTMESEKTVDSGPAIVLPEGAIELNSNVFLELKVIQEEVEALPESTRRPIFAYVRKNISLIGGFSDLFFFSFLFFSYRLPDPDLSDEIGQETSATWVELFSDVFYVGWLSSFTHAHHMVDSVSLSIYVGWFVVMWWTWCSSALYSARYDNGDVMHHIYKIIDLCGLIGMAGASDGYETSSAKGFIIGYMVMKAVLLIQYSVVLWAATLSGSFARRPLSIYVAVNALAIILWGVSLLFLESGSSADDEAKHKTIRLALWYVSIVIEVLVNMSLQRFKQVSLAASHLAERFGLFTIIILGENCIGFIKMVSESHAEVRVVVANMFGLVIIFLFFFMYFDDFSKEILSEVQVSQIWMYLHFPLHLCQVAYGIAMTDIITAYRLKLDIPENAALAFHEQCQQLEHSTTQAPTQHAAFTLVESLTRSLMMASTEAVTSESTSSDLLSACEELGGNSDGLDYVYKAFWITGGLILCINALIKLVNTPVRAKWSRLICGSRFLNAIVFFGLSAASFSNFNGLGMLGIMLACLVLQSSIDLLD